MEQGRILVLPILCPNECKPKKRIFFEGGHRETWDGFPRTSGGFCNGGSINFQNLTKKFGKFEPRHFRN